MNSITEATQTDTSDMPCRGCGGTGVQRNQRTGIAETCPVCGGSGKMNSRGILLFGESTCDGYSETVQSRSRQ